MARPVPRRALVLGGGEVLGYAWTLGALVAVESAFGLDLREVDLAVGTSAGAVVAGMLGCGLAVGAMCRHHQGVPLPGDPPIGYDYDGTGGAFPPRPGLRPAAPRLLLDALRHPGRVSPLVALSGLLPAGRASLAPVHALLTRLAAEAGFASRWPDRPRTWVVALDRTSGRRMVFGPDGPDRPGGAPARVAWCARGVRVHVLAPGPADLAGMAVNLMDPRGRIRVLQTARRTAVSRLQSGPEPVPAAQPL